MPVATRWPSAQRVPGLSQGSDPAPMLVWESVVAHRSSSKEYVTNQGGRMWDVAEVGLVEGHREGVLGVGEGAKGDPAGPLEM